MKKIKKLNWPNRARTLILPDNLKTAKVKLFSENNLMESTSLWIKSDLKIDTNPGKRTEI